MGTESLEIFLGNTIRVDPDLFDIGSDFIVQEARPAISGENVRPKPGVVRLLYPEGNEVGDATYPFFIGPDGCILYPGALYYLLANRPVGEAIDRLDTKTLERNAIHAHFHEILMGELWIAVSVPYTVHLPKGLPIGRVTLEDPLGD